MDWRPVLAHRAGSQSLAAAGKQGNSHIASLQAKRHTKQASAAISALAGKQCVHALW